MKYLPLLAVLLATSPVAAAETSLRYVERATTDTISVHAGHAADNVGDVLTFTNDLFDDGNKTKSGTDQGYCVRMLVNKVWECHFTVLVAGGTLSVDGPFADAGDTRLAVTGGTGAYGGARGEMLLHARDAKGSAFDFTFSLR